MDSASGWTNEWWAANLLFPLAVSGGIYVWLQVVWKGSTRGWAGKNWVQQQLAERKQRTYWERNRPEVLVRSCSPLTVASIANGFTRYSLEIVLEIRNRCECLGGAWPGNLTATIGQEYKRPNYFVLRALENNGITLGPLGCNLASVSLQFESDQAVFWANAPIDVKEPYTITLGHIGTDIMPLFVRGVVSRNTPVTPCRLVSSQLPFESY